MVRMCMLGDVAATINTIGSTGDGHLENSKAQVGGFGAFFACLPILRLADRIKAPTLFTDGYLTFCALPTGS